MMTPDIFVLGLSLAASALFVTSHLVCFRWVSEGGVLKWIMNIFLIIAVIVLAIGSFVVVKVGSLAVLPVLAKVLCLVMAMGLYGFISVLYILYIFGPYESSVRLRVIREFYNALPNGLTREELLGRYNRELVLRRRLKRLLASGEVALDGDVYRVQKKQSFFMISDVLVRIFKKLGMHS